MDAATLRSVPLFSSLDEYLALSTKALLIWLADQQGIQDEVVEAVFRAYFTEGRDISRAAVLFDVMAEAGLDRNRAEAVLNSDEGLAAIFCLRPANVRSQ